MRFFYSLTWWLILPFVLLRLYLRGKKESGYRQHIAERLGFFPPVSPARQRIWVHAVSVGETRAAEPLIRALLSRYPQCEILLTHMTPTGRATGSELFGQEKRLMQVYLPYDTNIMMQRFIRHFRPVLCVLLETEIWPNLIAQCVTHRVPLALVNARLSERSLAKGRKFRSIMQEAAQGFSLVAAQTETDAKRLSQFGSARIVVTGSVKFDIRPPQAALEKGTKLRQCIGNRPVLVCASTRDGEENLILDALDRLESEALLLLIPRHPQRFETVAQQIQKRQIPMVRRSALGDFSGKTVPSDTRILLGDSMGEMFSYYAAGDVAFIGGSLKKLGGQNLIEACAVGLPVLIGPHTFNFEAISADAVAAGAAIRIASATELMQEVNELFANAKRRHETGDRAKQFAVKQHGATERTMALLAPLMEEKTT